MESNTPQNSNKKKHSNGTKKKKEKTTGSNGTTNVGDFSSEGEKKRRESGTSQVPIISRVENGHKERSSDEHDEVKSSTSRDSDISSSSSSINKRKGASNGRKNLEKEGDDDSTEISDFFPKEINMTIKSRKDAWPDKKKKGLRWISTLEFGNLQLALKYVISDTRRHKRAWLIGFFTVFLVVWFTSLLQASIAKSPIVFLKLSEDQVGEYDLLLTPMLTNDVRTFWINYTDVHKKLQSADLVKGSVPRWVLLGNIYNTLDQTKNTSTAMLIIDSDKEQATGIGRGWNHKLLGEDDTHVSSSVLRTIGVNANAGETVILEFDFIGLGQSLGAFNGQSFQDFAYGMIIQNINLNGIDPANVTLQQLIPTLSVVFPGVNITAVLNRIFQGNIPNNLNVAEILKQFIAQLTSALVIRREYLVLDGLDSPGGKYPKALGNVALIESKGIYKVLNQLVDNIKNGGFLPDPRVLRLALPFITDPQQKATLTAIINGLDQVDTIINNFQKNFRIDDYALSVVVMYTKRFESYIKSQKGLDADMVVFTNQVSDALGFTYPATFTLPLQASLIPLSYIRLFLDQIFTFVLVVLIVLGGLLIYSLLLSNVEEKTYEYGMLRAMGMKQYVLIELLFAQSLSFSIPAIALGLAVGFLVFVIVAVVIANFALSPIDVTMDSTAIVLAFLLGLLMPIISIIGPINRALSRTLRDALDIYHQVQSETAVRIIKLEELGLSPWQVSASVMMIIMGFVVYYLIPYTFTFGNLPLFFTILILILLGMLFGLSLIGTMLQPYAEKLAVYVILWGEEYRTLSHLVRKNLSSHGRRNIKTAVMFTTSLAFIIFAGSSFSLQGHTITEVAQLASGSDLVVFSTVGTYVALNEDPMREYLESEMARDDPLVIGFSFATPPLDRYRYSKGSKISNLAGFPSTKINIYAVEENYLDETFVRFYRPSEVSSQFTYKKTQDGKDDAISSLYRDAGKAQLPQEKDGIKIPPDITSKRRTDKKVNGTEGRVITIEEAYTQYIDVVISEATRLVASVDTSTPLKLTQSYVVDATNTTSIIYLCKARAMVKTFPGFFFSSYRQTASNSPVIITMDQYYRLMKDMYYGAPSRKEPIPEKPAKMTLRVKLKDGASKADRETIANGLRNFIKDNLTQLLDTADLVGSTQIAITLLTLFFNLVSIIAVVLCFFVLWLSFTANVNENSWEFGVLRAVGLNVNRVIRMYIYEALCIIISSVLIGAVIGMLVSITLTLQFNLFTELAFSFDFPYALFFSVFAMSVLVAIFGSYIPALSLRKKDIAIALKNM